MLDQHREPFGHSRRLSRQRNAGVYADQQEKNTMANNRMYLTNKRNGAKRANVKHPIQPLETDNQGVIRFKANKIVQHLLNHGGIDRNHLAKMDFPREDWHQFYQLLGYSHSDIPACDSEVWEAAHAIFKAGLSEEEARNNYLRDELEALKAALRQPIARLYGVHPDDLTSG